MTQKIVNVSEIEEVFVKYADGRLSLSVIDELRDLLDKAPSAGNWTDFSIDTTKADYIQIGNIVYFGLKSQGEQHALQEAIRAVASKAFERGRDSVVTAPSVSGEAVVSNKAILIDTDSNEFLMAKMRIWNEYSSAYRDSGDDVVNRSKALHKGIIEGIKLAVNEYNLNTTPQPDRVSELEAKLKVAVEALTAITYSQDGYARKYADESLEKIEE